MPWAVETTKLARSYAATPNGPGVSPKDVLFGAEAGARLPSRRSELQFSTFSHVLSACLMFEALDELLALQPMNEGLIWNVSPV